MSKLQEPCCQMIFTLFKAISTPSLPPAILARLSPICWNGRLPKGFRKCRASRELGIFAYLLQQRRLHGALERRPRYLGRGIARAQDIDQKSGKHDHINIIRRMRYHSAGCLAGLGQKKEADELYQQLLKEAKEANDTRLLEDLKNDGIGN